MDQKRLMHVFSNLLHNALDAMPGGGQITIGFELRPNEVVTEIEDTGPGIAEQILPRLFEAFATFGKAKGTGLGLSICKRIVEDHRGWITARNEPGRGAVFSFGLPLQAS
jgi:signal transduction histidine kinase